MKEFIAGIIGAIGVWTIVIPARESLLVAYGIQHQYAIGLVLVFFAWWLGVKK